MKLVFLCLAVLAGSALADVSVLQAAAEPAPPSPLPGGLEVCTDETFEACCKDFDYGIAKDGLKGLFPKNTVCTFKVAAATPVTVTTKDVEDHTIVKQTAPATVNLVTEVKLTLLKYNPPNSIWADGKGSFCICPSKPPAPPAPVVVTVVPVPPSPPATLLALAAKKKDTSSSDDIDYTVADDLTGN